MKQSKTFASGFPVEETIETLRQQLAEKDAEIARLKAENRDACIGLNDHFENRIKPKKKEPIVRTMFVEAKPSFDF